MAGGHRTALDLMPAAKSSRGTYFAALVEEFYDVAHSSRIMKARLPS
jgi:hypothetical protein